MITIKFNGTAKQAKEGMILKTFLLENGIDPYQTVTELNLEIISPEELTETVLKDGDVLEVLRFVGGG